MRTSKFDATPAITNDSIWLTQGSLRPADRLCVSIGVCAYNEEANIGRTLESLQIQQLRNIQIAEIVVVSSACRDRTDEIVERFGKGDQRIELIRQKDRLGKASAVNLFLQTQKSDICVLAGADTVLEPATIERLCEPFRDDKIGMTGARPIPVNDPSTFMGFASNLVWQLAHRVSLADPKMGELIAFRPVFHRIPEDTPVDEASIEAEVRQKGYVLKYVPNAVVRNRGPETIADYVKQRRRIHAGHLYLKKTKKYGVSTMRTFTLLRFVVGTIRLDWRSIVWTPLAMTLEFYSRLAGTKDFYSKKGKLHVWERVSSTKDAIEV